MTGQEISPFEGLTGATRLGLARAAIRTRESGTTLSAWRLAARAVEGEGAIVQVEIPGRGTCSTCYRGEGIFLGWPQPRLAAAYRRLLPAASDPEPDPGQLG